MIKTAKMQGNVMVSAGGRGARGREDRHRGTSTGDERGTPGTDRDPVQTIQRVPDKSYSSGAETFLGPGFLFPCALVYSLLPSPSIIGGKATGK